MTGFVSEADQIPAGWAAHHWRRRTCVGGNGGWRHNRCVPAVSTKGLFYLIPELSSNRPRVQTQLENPNFYPPHPESYSIVSLCFHFPLPHPLTVHKVTGACAQVWCIYKKLNSQRYVLMDTIWRWNREKILVLWKCSRSSNNVISL